MAHQDNVHPVKEKKNTATGNKIILLPRGLSKGIWGNKEWSIENGGGSVRESGQAYKIATLHHNFRNFWNALNIINWWYKTMWEHRRESYLPPRSQSDDQITWVCNSARVPKEIFVSSTDSYSVESSVSLGWKNTLIVNPPYFPFIMENTVIHKYIYCAATAINNDRNINTCEIMWLT